jgi:hypothetical protein
MTQTDQLLAWTESLKKTINDSPYPPDDVRKDFLALLFDVADDAYKRSIFLDIAKFTDTGQLKFIICSEGNGLASMTMELSKDWKGFKKWMLTYKASFSILLILISVMLKLHMGHKKARS